MHTTILIPARYASTRYPGKPLAVLTQNDGSKKSLIQMTWEAAKATQGVDAIYVATDDDRIAEAAKAFGADVIMTDAAAENGTARCADAMKQADLKTDLIVNLQGDAPLTPPWFLEALIEAMSTRTDVDAATPVLRCDGATYAMFKEDRAAGRVGGTTAVFGNAGQALYFSKEVIPYIDPGKLPEPLPVFHHVGVYAYRPAALEKYVSWREGTLEIREGLEQLRFLENGARLLCVQVEGRGRVFWELNNPEDVPRIEAVLRGDI